MNLGGAVFYQIEFTERAAAQRDALPEDRSKLLERGLHKLAEDPFPPVSRAVSGEDIRVVSAAPGLTLGYMIHRAFLILVSVAILDQSLIDDE
ncbi:hypothetical protein WB401_37025 [Streptomyces brasiliscabiei]|uniref:type II toxin-antitoxin system RelE family toxin n=1 Tax=Streptomyces brasiliscabiei TaxID=2736302 RepID=UPI003015100D